ncbi:hypothetical protein AB6A40_011109 [Gnathostoma spinigerum]|uniref:Uncharacterized protein n=1 Tax=Gnathostoma spinigerum TaxID=75299 RepID=A0ABD6EY70_9BILA
MWKSQHESTSINIRKRIFWSINPECESCLAIEDEFFIAILISQNERSATSIRSPRVLSKGLNSELYDKQLDCICEDLIHRYPSSRQGNVATQSTRKAQARTVGMKGIRFL